MTLVYLLKQSIPMYVPYAKATMYMESDILTNEVNEMAVFILSELYREMKIEELEHLIHVPSETFQELIEYLMEHGLLNDGIVLTERGEMYAKLHAEIERFNKQRNEVLINLYTGELELDLTPETALLPQGVLKAPIKIQNVTRKLYEDNIDAAPNTQKIIEALMERAYFNPEFSENIFDTLHLQLKLQPGEVWVQRFITSFPMSAKNRELELYKVEENGEPFHLTFPVKLQVLKPMHELVLQYCKDVPFLEKLSEELLSEKALKILKHVQKGEKIGIKQVHHYAYIERSFEESLVQEESKNFKKLALPDQFDWIDHEDVKEQFLAGLGSKWQLVIEQEKEEVVHIKGPFHAFFYTEADYKDRDDCEDGMRAPLSNTNILKAATY